MDMIDRKARSKMVEVIRAYMEERVAAFEFDDSLWKIAHATNDSTIKTVAELMWGHYSDLEDHKIVASKTEWDYFNRLLLLLASDAEVEVVETRRHWSIQQALAALCLVGFVFVAIRYRLGNPLLVYALFSSAVSVFLLWLTFRRQGRPSSAEIAMTPFPSVSSLLSIRRSVAGFARKRYPPAIARRWTRHQFANKFRWLLWCILLPLYSPIMLLFQMLPKRESETRIRMAEPSRSGTHFFFEH